MLAKDVDKLLIQKGYSSSLLAVIDLFKWLQGGVLLQEWHKDRLEHLIPVLMSSHFSTKNNEIWNDAVKEMQGCRTNSEVYMSVNLYSVNKLPILPLTKATQSDPKTIHIIC